MRKLLTGIVGPTGAQDVDRPDRFPLMDSIRALAALSIVVYHASLRVDVPSLYKPTLDALAIGVPVFFLVSGFLLYRPFAVAMLQGHRGPRGAAFAWRRFLRIVPAFWVALTLVAFLGEGRIPAGDLPALYGFAQVYDRELLTTGLPQAWSLNCEIVYYAMIPLLVIALRGLAGAAWSSKAALQWWGLAALVALSVGYKLAFHSFGDLRDVRDQAFPFQPGWNLDMFVAGMALALWSATEQVRERRGRLSQFVERRSGRLWLGALLMFLLVAGLLPEARDPWVNGAYHVARIAFSVLLILPAIHGRVAEGRVRRLLANRWLLGLGVVSYGLYLFHLQVLGVAEGAGLRGGALMAGTVAASIAVAVASWVLIERPALRLRHLVPERRHGVPSEPVGAATPVLARAER